MERVVDAQAAGQAAGPTGDAELAEAVGAAPAPPLRERLASWLVLLDRPLTSYYLIVGITALLLGLGLVMVLSTSSVQDLSEGLPAYSDFKKQLLGAAIGLPVMYIAARSSPRVFRAAAYPLLGASVIGLGLTLIPGVAVSQNGAARWIPARPLPGPAVRAGQDRPGAVGRRPAGP